MTNPTATATKPGMFDDVVVRKPEASNEQRRRYLCTIRPEAIPGLDRLDLQFRVGKAVFARQSFVWEGAGDDAKQVFLKGSVCVLTDAEVADVKAKIKYRYVRPTFTKGILTGVADIDASDSGGILVDEKTKVETPRAPQERPGRTIHGDIPLKDVVDMNVVYEDKAVRGRVVTLEEARAIVAAAEEEVNRPLESPDATFETGRGGKAKAPKSDPAEDAALEALSKSRPAVGAAPPIESTGFAGTSKVASGKSGSGGAGRLPEK